MEFFDALGIFLKNRGCFLKFPKNTKQFIFFPSNSTEHQSSWHFLFFLRYVLDKIRTFFETNPDEEI